MKFPLIGQGINKIKIDSRLQRQDFHDGNPPCAAKVNSVRRERQAQIVRTSNLR
jgi:hypothetical protein